MQKTTAFEITERLEDCSDMLFTVQHAIRWAPMHSHPVRRRVQSAVRQLSELLDEIVKEAQEKYPAA